MQQKICVLEVNEVPIRVWKTYSEQVPTSAVRRLFSEGKLYKTSADDVTADFLYPSQTWASLNTGLSYDAHQIHWYNDPKPQPDQFWWHQAALSGRRVGLVNVLHTSPLDHYLTQAPYSFLVPDCFAPNTQTFPARYCPFQSMNLQLAKTNGRIASSRVSELFTLAKKSLADPAGFGVTPFTILEGMYTLPKLIKSRERLRNLQFPPLGSIFFSLLQQNDPDIAVLFTNHIAAAQHRYWYALFPNDYAEAIYSDAWVHKYRNDILDAVGIFDRFLKKVSAFCKATDRILLIVSSMGQQANRKLSSSAVAGRRREFSLSDPLAFLRAAIGPTSARLEGAMVPQYTISFDTSSQAEYAARQMADFLRNNPSLSESSVYVANNKLTMSLLFSSDAPISIYDGKKVGLTTVGVRGFDIDDHHSGCHHADGTLLIWNDTNDALFSPQVTPSSFSYLRYAAELRRYLHLNEAPVPTIHLKDQHRRVHFDPYIS
ncbi:hypothetical protein [Noviherbaspirillum saxi]|uniref:Uncharacterized protein n=1 Tax=Noviherbaspirillum saxi TaxID=2320863 RepID=A0A3A3G6R7_9BURK|nr:hypothetical protein [Noviherbaspirillum saxi]RJF95880.1 hypothetical protein D3871_21185 [Noviherbaspirillum saxi]